MSSSVWFCLSPQRERGRTGIPEAEDYETIKITTSYRSSLLKTCFMHWVEEIKKKKFKDFVLRCPLDFYIQVLNFVSLLTDNGSGCTQWQVSQHISLLLGLKIACSHHHSIWIKKAAGSCWTSCHSWWCFLQQLPLTITDANRIINWKGNQLRKSKVLGFEVLFWSLLPDEGMLALLDKTCFGRLGPLIEFSVFKILHISYKDHVTNEEVPAKIQQAIGPH